MKMRMKRRTKMRRRTKIRMKRRTSHYPLLPMFSVLK
jgi:hypothetical protein